MNRIQQQDEFFRDHYLELQGRADSVEIVRQTRTEHDDFWEVRCYDYRGWYIGGTSCVRSFKIAQAEAYTYAQLITQPITTH